MPLPEGPQRGRLQHTCPARIDERTTLIAIEPHVGGANAPRDVSQGADTAVWLALDAPAKLTGQFFRDRKPIEW